MTIEWIKDVAQHFCFEGELVSSYEAESGHINLTFFVEYKCKNNFRRYILQRVNTNVFKKPWDVMENIHNITTFIREKIIAAGGDPERRVLKFVETTDGGIAYIDKVGGFWRAYVVVENARTFESAMTPQRFYKVGKSFGEFQMQLSDFPAEKLHETIPNFHNTESRYNDFLTAVKNDVRGRAAEVTDDIEFVKYRSQRLCSFINNGIKEGKFPIRVTHNDTKMDNILIDNETGDGVCVIDLDTVMPGSVLNDFGDAIRFGASSAAEDECDIDKVFMRLDMFEGFTRGFIDGLDGSLTQPELVALPMGALILTYETGIRFLTDYLNGDIYFRIHREEHNLDRARNQFKLVADMEVKMGRLNEIIRSLTIK